MVWFFSFSCDSSTDILFLVLIYMDMEFMYIVRYDEASNKKKTILIFDTHAHTDLSIIIHR